MHLSYENEPRSVQVVLGCLDARYSAGGHLKTWQGSSQGIDALVYFNIPQRLWPAGLRLLHRGQSEIQSRVASFQKRAEDIVAQISVRLERLSQLHEYALFDRFKTCEAPVQEFSRSAGICVIFKVSSNTWHSDCELPDDTRMDHAVFPSSSLGNHGHSSATLQPDWLASELAAAIILAGQSQHLSINFTTYSGYIIVQLGLAPLPVFSRLAS